MSDELRKLIIDGEEIEVPAAYTVLQACEEAGREIPRFCYHERLSIAGNCRMCLVEAVGAPKPIASCAFGVRDLRPGPNGEPPKVNTKSAMVKKAREGVMEFLLINHPLDCPICDQGGECDLQDQAMAYGRGLSRYDENKRAVEDKYMGPLVKTIMTRCIQCTRCVRFASEVAGVDELGMIGRGENAEITTYLEKSLTSELSGNVIDLCPVGALTSKPYAFKGRPWELTKTETIDVMDAVGTNIRVDVAHRKVQRIMPRLHEGVNEEWISDKSRFIWDGLAARRLDRPYVRDDGALRPSTWDEAFAFAAAALGEAGPDEICAVAGDLADAEAMKALLDLMRALGVRSVECRNDGAKLPTAERAAYLFNPTIAGAEEADVVLIVGANPRKEAPLVNHRIRKAWLHGDARIGLIGETVDLSYPYEHLGTGPAALSGMAAKKGAFFEALKGAERPMIVIGQGALAREDGAQVLKACADIAAAAGVVKDGWNGWGVLHTAASRVGGLDMGFTPDEGGRDMAAILDGLQLGEVKVAYLLGVDDAQMKPFKDAFVIYQGHHGDAGAAIADVILPGAAYTEKDGLYVNMEGRVQIAKRATIPPGEAREDWAILRALSARLGRTLPYDDLGALRTKLIQDVPSFGSIDHAERSAALDLSALGEAGAMKDDEPFTPAVTQFYAANPIARASQVMRRCAEETADVIMELAAE